MLVRYAEGAITGADSCTAASLWNVCNLESRFRCLLWITALASLCLIDHQLVGLSDSDLDLKDASV
jgi:hypothetical protein